MVKFVFAFEEGSKEQKNILGGKGANLSEMKKIGLPVPDGFTITTKACTSYYEENKSIKRNIKEEIYLNLKILEEKTGKTLGGLENPLLVSVRSGSVISMPGMMDTVLNLGLNDDTLIGLTKKTSNPAFALDSYRRFIQMFSDVVLNIEKYKFDRIYKKNKIHSEETLKELIINYKKLVKKETKKEFPMDPKVQLDMAIEAVFDSWNNHRAIIYRKINNIPDSLGTAVNIQSMVFGNIGETSGTGVAFTRNPSTGENKLYGEYLLNAQGEDVVAGIRTPLPINMLENSLPEVFKEFSEVAKILENHYLDMQDIEFTIENEKLYMLQTRTGKRTAEAAMKIAVDLVKEEKIDKETAIMRIDPEQISQLLHPTFSVESLNNATELSKGLPASPGAASGKIYFDSESIKLAKSKGEKTILVRTETSPEDIEGMINSEGILTSRGGMTSHAAVVARGMGKCCIAGCPDVFVEEYHKQVKVGNITLFEGDEISLNGSTGIIYNGLVKTSEINLTDSFKEIMKWSKEIKVLGVRANADNYKDASIANEFGAEGIGLCRTEHMFFEESRIFQIRKLILANNLSERKEALKELLPFQEKDFFELFLEMREKPVTIRLLDPPLHEFLPKEENDIEILSKKMNITAKAIKKIIENISEINPMLGHRGCRLGITYPEIYEMQVQAIFLAVSKIKKEHNLDVKPEIMIPLIGFENELSILKDLVNNTAKKILKEKNIECVYKVGTMIEVPRAALTADEIAVHAEFFSFGTNDLTQMTLGFSRDDSGKFISEYKNKSIFEVDPFESIDQKGVGKLMKLAKTLGRETRKNLKLGICGEHGGEPKSIKFCHDIGLDYVSCSPFRVPIAILAAAQAAIEK